MTADFVISLSRKIEDKIAGTGRWHVIKNRFGPDGITFPSKMNMSNGQIQIYEETSVNGKQAQKQMDGGSEALRKRLAKKYTEVQPTENKSKDPFANLQWYTYIMIIIITSKIKNKLEEKNGSIK